MSLKLNIRLSVLLLLLLLLGLGGYAFSLFATSKPGRTASSRPISTRPALWCWGFP